MQVDIPQRSLSYESLDIVNLKDAHVSLDKPGHIPAWAIQDLEYVWKLFKEEHKGKCFYAQFIYRADMEIPEKGKPESYILDFTEVDCPPTGDHADAIPFVTAFKWVWGDLWMHALQRIRVAISDPNTRAAMTWICLLRTISRSIYVLRCTTYTSST